ncbi:hypothetical protein CORC01_13005 [Colletotrichum orchidophilum]|uniref:Uncharacterized protein n=1 Tax=Colletotrichum orchidophilum TaxID=1209926 RepID=A0A1G4ARB6_9PEZI|nr:uncharacterized protein CORC01_13005 [Colletotrichum orchidophilum]OHE91714.1 hypothetical protein CORC01_13005 [Colletotrichum orchidophilum]
MALPNPLLALLAMVLAMVLATAHALNVTVPSEIEAGVPTEIEIGFDFWKQPYVYETLPGPVFDETTAVCRNPVDKEVGCGHDMLYEHYQLFLYTDEWMYTCYLSDLIPVGTTNPKITIPKDLGPSEKYKITAMEFNGTEVQTNQYGVESSSYFTLVDTDIKAWTSWEHYGGWLKPWSLLPCSSYACYRTCGLKFADEQGNKKQGTAAGLYDCLNECPGIRADWNDPSSEWSWYKAFDGQDWSGESTAVTTSTPSAISTSGWGYQTADKPETTLYGTPTAPTVYSWESLLTMKPTATATAHSSAGRRRAKPPVAVPKKVSYAGLMATTVLTCLVAFAIGSVLGWIWPDGLRHEG